MKSRKVIVLVGIPSSGKSTWATEFVKKNSKWVRINRDDYRFMMKNLPTMDNRGEKLITKLVDDAVISALNSNFDVIIDQTNVKEKYLQHWCDLLKCRADVEFKIFDIPYKVALERDSKRERSVGEQVLKKMYDNYINVLHSFDFSYRKREPFFYNELKWDKKLPKAVIFDIDGTLAHINGKRSPYDMSKVDLDDVSEIVREEAILHANNGYEIILVSGRSDDGKLLTEEWLDFYEIPWNLLFMRKEGDMRKDSIVKKEIYNEYIKDNYYIHAVFDDRNQTVKAWRELGLKCFQVEDGNF